MKTGRRPARFAVLLDFYRSLDFRELWEDFFDSVNSNGTRKWKSAKQLANSLGKTQAQKDFLIWVLGPDDDSHPSHKERFPQITPLDFDKKRDEGGWFTEASLKKHAGVIKKNLTALEALKMVGEEVTVHSLSRMENLARTIDKEFAGKLFVDGLDWKENKERAQLYVSLHLRVLNMIDQAQDIYAKSHGINFSDMSGFEKLLTAQALAINATLANQTSAHESRQSRLLNGLITMTLEKAAERGLPLPKDVSNVIEMSVETPKKKVVQ